MQNCESRACRVGPDPRHPAAMLLLAAGLATILGCGVGDYRDRIDAGVRALADASDTAGLYAAQPLGQTPIAVRVPQAFTRPPLVAGVAIAEEGAPPDEVRVQPGLIDLPGLTYTYEEFVVDSEGGRIPYYLYISAADTGRSGFRDPTSRWVNQLRERFPDRQIGWEDVSCDTPQGRSVVWRRLRIEGEQVFYYVGKDGQGREQRLPGLFEVYYRVDGNWAVALAWRVPAMIAEHADVAKWGPIVAGAVDFTGHAERAGAPLR